MGPVEEVGKATGSIIDSLKREPLSLALVVMNLALLVFFWTILTAVAHQREVEVKMLYDDKRLVSELLSKCIVPGKTEQESGGGDHADLVPLPIPKPPE